MACNAKSNTKGQNMTTAEAILEWANIAGRFGFSIDWKMRLRNEVYQTQIDRKDLTAQMLNILQQIRNKSHYDFKLMAYLLDGVIKHGKLNESAVDMRASDLEVEITDDLRNAVNWCVNYHLGQHKQKKTDGKSALVTMDLHNWERRGRPLVRKLKAEDFTSIAMMMTEAPQDSPEWREVHHVWPNDASYIATHAGAVRMPKFDAYIHTSDDNYYNTKSLQQMGSDIIPIITSPNALTVWRGSYYDRIGMPWNSQSIAIDMHRIATGKQPGCPLMDRSEPMWVFEPQPCRYEAMERRGKAAWAPSSHAISPSEMVDVIQGNRESLRSEAYKIDPYVGVTKGTLVSFNWEPVLITLAYDRQRGGKVLLISDRGWEWLRENPSLARTLWYEWMKPLRRKGVRLVRETDITVNLATFTQDLPLDRPITSGFVSQAIHEHWHEWKYQSAQRP